MSLVSRGSRRQLAVAVVLVSVLPLLSFGFIALTVAWPTGAYSNLSRGLVAAVAMLLGVCGYAILSKYPRNIERLRLYLNDIAAGQLPNEVILPDQEDDLSAIQNSLNVITAELRGQVKQLQDQLALSRKMQKTIENQAAEILIAERHRVMIESMGAACHHIGQPATVLRISLESLRKDMDPARRLETINLCLEAVEAIAGILEKLRHVGEYRTVPYQTFGEGPGADLRDFRILDIEQKTADEPQGANHSGEA